MSRLRRGARPAAPLIRTPTLGLLLFLTFGFPFFGDFLVAGGSALASLSEPGGASASLVQIVRPSASAPVADGNLTYIEATVVDPVDGAVERVEVAIDNDDQWRTAERAEEDSTRWRHLWSDPTPGYHRIRVRAFGIEGHPVVEQSAIVEVAEVWTSTYIIDHPYAVPGTYRKGQVHVHSTASFDGWNSLPPAELALAYKARGYQFVAITDHNVVSQPRGVEDAGFITIPAHESTADSGHITGLFTDIAVSSSLSPQDRIAGITAGGGVAILNHPEWRVGWKGADLIDLHGYTAVEIFNGMTSDARRGAGPNLALWQAALNAKGWPSRVWAVAVDDAHDLDHIDVGWIMVKSAQLTPDAILQAIRAGAFYASNGPSFRVLGVLNGAITASSGDASVIRFLDQDGSLVLETPGTGGAYRPSGKERWIRVEAVAADGRTAWSQPFWIVPNAPRVSLSVTSVGTALVGQTLPGARVHLSDRGQYLGSVVADGDGNFAYSSPSLSEGDHEFWILATAPWPDQVEGPPTLFSWGPSVGRSPIDALGKWIIGFTSGPPRGPLGGAPTSRS